MMKLSFSLFMTKYLMKDFSQITFTIRIYLAPKTKSWISSSAVVPMSLWENLVFPWISSKKYNSKTPSILLSLFSHHKNTHIHRCIHEHTYEKSFNKKKTQSISCNNKISFYICALCFWKKHHHPEQKQTTKKHMGSSPIVDLACLLKHLTTCYKLNTSPLATSSSNAVAALALKVTLWYKQLGKHHHTSCVISVLNW